MLAGTGIFVEHLRVNDKLPSSLYKISEKTGIYVSAVTMYELHMGATTTATKGDVEAMTDSFTVLPFTNGLALKGIIL